MAAAEDWEVFGFAWPESKADFRASGFWELRLGVGVRCFFCGCCLVLLATFLAFEAGVGAFAAGCFPRFGVAGVGGLDFRFQVFELFWGVCEVPLLIGVFFIVFLVGVEAGVFA